MSQPTEPQSVPRTRLSRRRALGGVAGVGLGLPLLAACGGEDTSATDSTAPSPADAPTTGNAQTDAAEDPSSFASTSDVPVGGGAVFPDEGIVVTQPTDGEFLGFSITCTHQGCPVESVTENGINCPCHGSSFDLSSGEPTAGPATAPLNSVALTIKGTDISRA